MYKNSVTCVSSQFLDVSARSFEAYFVVLIYFVAHDTGSDLPSLLYYLYKGRLN